MSRSDPGYPMPPTALRLEPCIKRALRTHGAPIASIECGATHVHAAEIHVPSTIKGAVEVIGRDPGAVLPMGGATWLMRASIRGEQLAGDYVALSGIPELATVSQSDNITVGAAVTHAQLAAAIAGEPSLRGLYTAASTSANPMIRNMATIGGNICTVAFPAADLVPALLSLEADVVIVGKNHHERLPLERYLLLRADLQPGTLLTFVIVPKAPVISAHARLTLRAAGDYPVAIFSAAIVLTPDRVVERARIAVGSVAPVPHRWAEMETAMMGRRLSADDAAVTAERLKATLDCRDGIEAPGWYRRDVIPTLARRAVASLETASTLSGADAGDPST